MSMVDDIFGPDSRYVLDDKGFLVERPGLSVCSSLGDLIINGIEASACVPIKGVRRATIEELRRAYGGGDVDEYAEVSAKAPNKLIPSRKKAHGITVDRLDEVTWVAQIDDRTRNFSFTFTVPFSEELAKYRAAAPIQANKLVVLAEHPVSALIWVGWVPTEGNKT